MIRNGPRKDEGCKSWLYFHWRWVQSRLFSMQLTTSNIKGKLEIFFSVEVCGLNIRGFDTMIRVLQTESIEIQWKGKRITGKEWILGALKIFKRLEIPDNDLWIWLAILTLTRDTAMWWRTVKRNYQVERMTWKELTEVFHRQHFNKLTNHVRTEVLKEETTER